MAAVQELFTLLQAMCANMCIRRICYNKEPARREKEKRDLCASITALTKLQNSNVNRSRDCGEYQ